MKVHLLRNLLLGVITVTAFSSPAKVIVVNTTNNATAGPGETNLVQALELLADGDSIRFSIPGRGPFYLITPPLAPDNGYPAITNNNVTIDGYSQPGAGPNSNPILCSNNARLQIVLDSRGGGAHVEDIDGYSTHEGATLMIKGATNVTLCGLCLLGPGLGGSVEGDPDTYAISFALGAGSGHVNGCWIGLDPDGKSVYRFRQAVTGFEGAPGQYINGTVIGVEKDAPDAPTARAQFNVVVGEYVLFGLEGENYRIAGNFLNVFPDGLTDYNINGVDPFAMEAFIEIGRRGNNLVIGTDGDGHNDADERNIFGGITVANDDNVLEWYGTGSTNMVIAGNYFGVGVDGTTRFTNSMKLLGGLPSSTTLRMGSDGDGISDDLEGNLISMNYPFDALFPSPAPPGPPVFADLNPGARVDFRRNQLLGNTLTPFTYADGNGDWLTAFTNYYAPYAVTAQIIPVLATNSSQANLRGCCAPGLAPYTNLFIDFYLQDDEGWTNGQRFQLWELSYYDPMSGFYDYNGFPQGRTWLGSFLDNGPQDLDPAPGRFDFDISALGVAPGQLVTATATWSADLPGTHNPHAHTSAFAFPIPLQPAPTLALTRLGNTLLLSWPTNAGVFSIQASGSLAPPAWTNLNPQPTLTVGATNYQASLPATPGALWLRLAR